MPNGRDWPTSETAYVPCRETYVLCRKFHVLCRKRPAVCGIGRVARGADGNGRADGYVIIHNKINTYNEKL